MSVLTSQEKINIFNDLFRGRPDVFAVRWRKKDGSASGYIPVCLNEWKTGICNKLQGKKCKDCQYSKYIGINDTYLEQHLRGTKTYGIYPLLADNTSYFVVADFDGQDWQDQIINFFKKCQEYNLPAYIERSRSGNGGHAWIFFADKYPAYKSRSIVINLLQEAEIIDQFEKEDSFDRLFPNQDALSGRGFGNLIALPLQGESRRSNNTVFLNPDNQMLPYADQWEFLKNVKKVEIKELDELYNNFNSPETKIVMPKIKGNFLNIIIGNQIYLTKDYLPKSLVNYLKDNLNFYNSDFLIKKKIGASVFRVEKYFKLIQTLDDKIAIPRGFLDKLVNFLKENKIAFQITDQRDKPGKIKFETNYKLFPYQMQAVSKMIKKENGILVAPPGSGKTIIGLDIIARQKQPALILVHKKQIFNQWLERIENFLNIPKREIGQYASSKKKFGKKITVAMVQTLSNVSSEELDKKFGLILVDECHHMPARTFRKVITKFSPYYLYGLTSTPKRKNNDTKLIFIFLGEMLYTIPMVFTKNDEESLKKPQDKKSGKFQNNLKITIRETNLEMPFKIRTDNAQLLFKTVIFDSQRNQQIVNDVKTQADQNKKCLILTERKEHVEILNCYLKREYETIVLTGELTEKQRKEKVKQIQAGHFQIIIATGQLIGEGTDFSNLDCLFLAFPFAFEGKLIQYIGRINRGLNTSGVIYDYNDVKVEYLQRFFKKRKAYYKKAFDLS